MASMTWLLEKRDSRQLPHEGTKATLGAFTLAYAVATLVAPSLFHGGWNLYFAQPLIWLSLAGWCLDEAPARAPGRAMLGLAALTGAFQVAVLTVAGLMLGFGNSPYAHSLLAIGGNVAYLGSLVVGIEIVRARLLNGRVGSMPLGPIAIAALFAFTSLTLSQWHLLAAGDTDAMRFTGQRILPAAADSWTATALAMLGGPWAAVAYRFTVMTSEWLSPVLPSLTWAQAAIAACVTPAVATIALRQAATPKNMETAEERPHGIPLWLGASAFVVVALIWLNAGLLGVKPAIVSGISMQPTLRQGDIVITHGVAPRSLHTGDVIRFREGSIAVIHRIKSISRNRDGLVFVTQGDNNPAPDGPITETDVQGKVVLTVPKLGLLPIAARRLLGR